MAKNYSGEKFLQGNKVDDPQEVTAESSDEDISDSENIDDNEQNR